MPTDHREEYELCAAAARRLADAGFGGAAVAIQTGSGLRPPALEERRTLEWTEIPGFPRATAPGHRGAIHHGLCHGVPAIVLEGRLHQYEGRTAAEVVRPLRAVALAGVQRFVLTNACGGVRESLRAGDVVRVTDHINLQRSDPLTGVHDPRFGDRFVVTAGRAYDRVLGRYSGESALEAGVRLHEGVYAAVPGPSFETPAEVRMLRALGADVVGMSTVPEVIVARHGGMRVLGFSGISNKANLDGSTITTHQEVIEAGRVIAPQMEIIIREVLRGL